MCGLVAVAVAWLSAAGAGPATAAPVRVLGAGGRVRIGNDRFLAPHGRPFAPPSDRGPRAVIADRSVATELARLLRAHRITKAAYLHYIGAWHAALGTERVLRGTPAVELEGVIQNLHAIAASGWLTPSRLPVLFETVARNRQWWSNGTLLSYGDRVEFAGSQLVWEYYPGQGIELQVLGTFGKVDSMFSGGHAYWKQMRRLVDEMIPMAAIRGGGVTWEYYFNFDGGVPPWTSAMSQGTAIQALTETYEATGERSYLNLAHRALPIFSRPSPTGVAVRTRRGTRYLLYSFAPGAAVLNGFLQSLICLFDYAKVSGDPRGAKLFARGDAEARWEVPHYDTGSWSLYQPGVEDTLSYHQLVTLFLHQLCDRTHARVYCRTAARFDSYQPPPGV